MKHQHGGARPHAGPRADLAKQAAALERSVERGGRYDRADLLTLRKRLAQMIDAIDALTADRNAA